MCSLNRNHSMQEQHFFKMFRLVNVAKCGSSQPLMSFVLLLTLSSQGSHHFWNSNYPTSFPSIHPRAKNSSHSSIPYLDQAGWLEQGIRSRTETACTSQDHLSFVSLFIWATSYTCAKWMTHSLTKGVKHILTHFKTMIRFKRYLFKITCFLN